jgi:hypothetical protein
MVVIQRAIEDTFVDDEVFGVSASFTFLAARAWAT